MNFTNSNALLERVLKVIPNGTQTFSKSQTQYPVGNSPLFVSKAKGSHIWDVDGNEFIDYVSGLCPIILGYCDEDVDNAVKEQIDKGVIYSLPHPLEVEVSEILQDMIPCAEMVRFGKNGSDVTAGGVRLARAYTGRDHIACCQGHYHGWQDWCNGITGRNAGVPTRIRELTHLFKYNDINSLENLFLQYPNQIACVIMEPMVLEWPNNYFLQNVKELCKKQKTILIFDEVITGFRWANGGAQEYFKVTPDLGCFGKAIANGYPLSALVGKAEIMRLLGDKVHFSFTNGGECLSLAAAKATLKKIREENVVPKIFYQGIGIKDGLIGLSSDLIGHPARTVWNLDEIKIKKIQQELIARGILIANGHNINYSHSDEDIHKLVQAYGEIIPNLDDIELKAKPIESGFSIRA